jgi:hypothetical protein
MATVVGDLLLDSLQRRMHTMHSLYYQAVDTMDARHVNHFEREGVLPIAFSLFHYTNTHVRSPSCSSPACRRSGTRSGMPVSERPSTTTGNTAPSTRWSINASATSTHSRSTSARWSTVPRRILRRWTLPTSPRVFIAPPYPPQVATTYSARGAGPEGITVLDGFECWIYQHGLRHMGEIELARGFVGLGGMTS